MIVMTYRQRLRQAAYQVSSLLILVLVGQLVAWVIPSLLALLYPPTQRAIIWQVIETLATFEVLLLWPPSFVVCLVGLLFGDPVETRDRL